MIDQEKLRARRARDNASEKARARKRKYDEKRRSDPDYRRWKTIYMMDYRHRRKHERWADQGLTLRA